MLSALMTKVQVLLVLKMIAYADNLTEVFNTIEAPYEKSEGEIDQRDRKAFGNFVFNN